MFNQRARGYRVRLDSTGQNALKACLSNELFERLKKCCAHSTKGMGPVCSLDALTGQRCEGVRFGRPNGGKVGAMESQPVPDVPHIDVEIDKEPLNADRSVLRGVLMRGLEVYVEFGKDFVGLRRQPRASKCDLLMVVRSRVLCWLVLMALHQGSESNSYLSLRLSIRRGDSCTGERRLPHSS